MNTTVRKLAPAEKSDFIALRAAVFGDDETFIDACTEIFGDKLENLVLEEEGRITSVLTRFETGELVRPSMGFAASPLPVTISYAIATDSAARGKGYGARITEEAARLAHEQGALSALSPAEPSLVNFYGPLGYLPYFYGKELRLTLNGTEEGARAPEIRKLTPEAYGIRRETYLANRSHLRLNAESLRLAEAVSLRGDALCEWEGKALFVIEEFEEGENVLSLSEFLPAEGENADVLLRALVPALLGILKEEHLSAEIHEISALTPASGDPANTKVFGMIAPHKGSAPEKELHAEIQGMKKDTGATLPYLGFTFG